MSNPIPVNIISDDDATPLQLKSKKQRISFDSNPSTVFIIDDEPTPRKPSPSPFSTSTPSVVPETPSVVSETPSVVPETPMLESTKSYVPIVRCSNSVSDPQLKFSSSPNPKPSGLICLESDEESEGSGSFPEKSNEPTSLPIEVENSLKVPSSSKASMLHDIPCFPSMLENELPQASQVSSHSEEEDDIQDSTSKNGPILRCNNFISSSNPKPSDNNKIKTQITPFESISNTNSPTLFKKKRLICLESDEESEGSKRIKNSTSFTLEVEKNSKVNSPCPKSSILNESSFFPYILEDEQPEVLNHSEKEDDIQNSSNEKIKPKGKNKKRSAELAGNKRNTKEEKARLMNEKKQQKEQEKLQKLALKAEAAELKKMQKKVQRYEKGKFALQSIVAKIDTKVIEQGSVGGQLLTRLAEKGITYQITKNEIEKSIIWEMNVPENIAQAVTRGIEISYILLIFEAEEFCKLVNDELLMDHVSYVQSKHPSYTICYLTNRLTAYVNKREQENFMKPGNNNGWRRPPFEQMLSKLTTHFVGVHSRLCTDESELAEHVVGLTSSLASCQFRKRLTRLSVNANDGTLIPKDSDRFLIKKNIWIKALIAIPKVQPRAAVAIWKKYPTMKSLLSVYMDPNKSEHEKEFLLENLKTEGVVGDNRRLGEVCSKRVYRILMAERGTTKTDDVENGADFFSSQWS